MQILRFVAFLPFLCVAAFGLNTFGERFSHGHTVRGVPRHGLRPSATLLRTAVRLRRLAHLSPDTAGNSSLLASRSSVLQSTGANVTLDNSSDKLLGVIEAVNNATADLRKGYDDVRTVCVDTTSRLAFHESVMAKARKAFQLQRESSIQETAMRKARLEYLVKQENDAKTSYDSTVFQRGQEIKEYLSQNKSLVEQNVVFGKVLDLLNAKKALVTAPKNYSENFSYVAASVVSASSMDYIIGVIQNLQSTAGTKSSELDTKFAKSDGELANLVSSYKASLMHIDEQYHDENVLKLQAEMNAEDALEERNLLALFLSGEEGLGELWRDVCGDSGLKSTSLSGCWVSPNTSYAPSVKPFTLEQSGEYLYTRLDGITGSGKVEDGQMSFEWPGNKLEKVPLHKIKWSRISSSPCTVPLEMQGLAGTALTGLDTSVSELQTLVTSTLSNMDSLPMVSNETTGLVQTGSIGSHRRPQGDATVDAGTVAGRRDELLRLAREVQMRNAHPEAAASTTIPPRVEKVIPVKPLLRVVARPRPVAQPSLEASVADSALHLLLGARQHGAAKQKASNASSGNAVFEKELTNCIHEKQGETEKIVLARQSLRDAQSKNVTATSRLTMLDKHVNMVLDQKGFLSDVSDASVKAYAHMGEIQTTKRFEDDMNSAIQEMDIIKTEVTAYINAGGPPAASGLLKSIDTIKVRLQAMLFTAVQDMGKLNQVQEDRLLLKFVALRDQLNEKSFGMIGTLNDAENTLKEAEADIPKQEVALQAAIVARETVEYRCQSPGSCGVLRYQQCCGPQTDTSTFITSVSTWDECTKHCEATLAAGHAVVGCEMESGDKSSPGKCSAVTTCTMAAESRECAGSRCKPTNLAIGQS